MTKLGFHILMVWAKMNAALPFWLLYLKSDVFYFIVYHIARYRRKVVRENLLRSFPDKPHKEIKAIEKRFYRNLCDQFVEAPKMMRMGPDGYRSRIAFSNPELAQHLYHQQAAPPHQLSPSLMEMMNNHSLGLTHSIKSFTQIPLSFSLSPPTPHSCKIR